MNGAMFYRGTGQLSTLSTGREAACDKASVDKIALFTMGTICYNAKRSRGRRQECDATAKIHTKVYDRRMPCRMFCCVQQERIR